MAGGTGIEPILQVPKTCVLPLDDPPIIVGKEIFTDFKCLTNPYKTNILYHHHKKLNIHPHYFLIFNNKCYPNDDYHSLYNINYKTCQ